MSWALKPPVYPEAWSSMKHADGARRTSPANASGSDVIEEHHGEVGGQQRHHEPPHVLVAPEPVREHHHGASGRPVTVTWFLLRTSMRDVLADRPGASSAQRLRSGRRKPSRT